jgi:hypothetical protein
MISFKTFFSEGYSNGSHELSPDQLADHAEHAKSFTDRHKEIIGEYKRGSSYYNNYLRHKGNDPESYHRAYTANNMDPAGDRAAEMDPITNHPMRHDTTVYRGFQDHSHKMMRSLKVGDTFTDHGYVGTSTNQNMAKRFAQPIRNPDAAKWDHPGILEKPYSDKTTWEHHYAEIHAPAGTRGHYLDMHGGHRHDEENELVLHRGTKFQVTHHTQHEGLDPHNANGGQLFKFHVTHLKVVGNENV